MKIWLVRHGEAMDDVRDEYGGWHDPELSEKGLSEAVELGKKLASKNLGAKKIWRSPLLRAIQTAEKLNEDLKLPIEECVYLKERNTYGLLCGINKDEAKRKYPELVEAYDAGKPVLGYEEYGFFVERVKALIEFFKNQNEDAIAVTHGKMIGAILTDIVGKKPKSIEQGCVIELIIDGVEPSLGECEGVEF